MSCRCTGTPDTTSHGYRLAIDINLKKSPSEEERSLHWQAAACFGVLLAPTP